jgi:sugar O-acyltransferase (sialic acid O-acetyltransferase NeuD family)
MKRVVIIGAGAHGREVAEIIRHQSHKDPELLALGFVDDDPRLRHQIIDDLPVLGDLTWFEGVDRDEVSVICGSGFSEIRKKMVIRAQSLGLSFINAISPWAYTSPNSRIGEGVVMYPNSIASRGTSIGDHALINLGAIVSHDTTVGSYGTINPGVNLAGNVTLGEGCYLGAGCSVIQGINIGAWAVVGAGAAVIRDLPESVTAVGVPAKIIERVVNG